MLWADTSVAGKISIKLYDGTDDVTLHTIVTSTNADEVAALKLNVLQPQATIASAATTDLSTVSSEEVSITGTTTITSLGTSSAGTKRNVNFAGALTLTHNATSLILPPGANILTAAGDRAEFLSLGSGNWICTGYLPVQNMGLLPLFGSGQTWQSVTRNSGTTYYNTTGKPILVKRNLNTSSSVLCFVTVGGVSIGTILGIYNASGTQETSGCFVVPPGQSYVMTDSGTGYTYIGTWELR
jgi:hypothetical protein